MVELVSIRRSWVWRYVLAAGLVAIVSELSLAFPAKTYELSIGFAFIAVTILSFLLWGAGPGVTTAAVSALLIGFLLALLPTMAPQRNTPHFIILMAILLLISLVLSRFSILVSAESKRRRASEALLNVASSAAGFLTKEQVARRVLGIALRAADMEAGAVWAAEDQGDRTVVLARRGRAEVSCDPLEVSMDKPCAVSRVIRSGVPLYGLVGGDECGLCRGASGGTRFAAVLPVASKGRVLGAVALFSLISRRVSRKDKALLARITYQLAVALENAALREQSARDREFLSSVIDHLPVGVLIVDAEQMSILGANGVAGEFLAKLFGGNPIGAHLEDLFAADAHRHLVDKCRSVVETGVSLHEVTCEIALPDGQMAHWRCNIAPFKRGENRVESLLVIVNDESERVRTAKRLAELMAASTIAPDDLPFHHEGLQAVLDTIPVGIAIFGAADRRLVMLNRVAATVMGRDCDPLVPPEKVPEAYGYYTSSGELFDPEMLPGRRAIRSGDRVVGEDMVIRRPDGTSVSVSVNAEPLFDADARAIAAVVSFHDVTVFTRQTQQLEKAYTREHTIAEALQKSLLTEPPERVGKLELAALYRPALDEAALGGDFYDAFSLSSRKMVLVIGDVSGKGLEAAAQLAAIKYSIRTFAYRTRRPRTILKRVNDALCRDCAVEGFVTLFCGVIDVRMGKLVWGNAGQEPPLLRRSDGGIEQLMPTGRALCVTSDSDYEDREVWLGDGDVLLLYTDGLSEARRESVMLSHEGIADILRGVDVTDVHNAASEIYSAVYEYASGSFRDDVALMLLRVTEPKRAARPRRPPRRAEPSGVPAAWV